MPNMPNITPTINEIPLLIRKVALAEEIINSSYYLSVSEHAIINIGLAKENQWNDEKIVKSKISVGEYQLQLQTKGDKGIKHKEHPTRDLDAAAARLKERDIKVRLAKGIKHYSWIIDWTSSKEFDGAHIEITWHPDIIKYLFNLKDYGGSYYLLNIQGLQCAYSPRVIGILSQNNYKSHGRIAYILEDWHYLFDIPESYKTSYKDFKRYVINAVVEDINARGKYKIGFNERKVGRKVVALELWFNYKDINKDNKAREDYLLNEIDI